MVTTRAFHTSSSRTSSLLMVLLPLILLYLQLTLFINTITCCQPGWVSFNEQKCLKYIAVNVNYADGEVLCKTNNATLASIHSNDEQDFILSMGRRHYTQSGVHWVWLGAVRNISDSDEFYWKDGTKFNFTNWRDGCPDRRQGENCVLMTIFKDRPSHWCNFKCDSNHDHVICQKPWTNDSNSASGIESSTTSTTYVNIRRPPPLGLPGRGSFSPSEGSGTGIVRNSGRTDFWGGFGGLGSRGQGHPFISDEDDECDIGWEFKNNKCYKFVHENVTGEEARYYCQRYNGQALTIHSEEEQTFAVDFAFYKNEAKEAVWLGAARSLEPNSTGSIQWRDGKPMDFTNWSPHEPDNRNKSENCVAMNDMRKFFGRWIDAPCSLHFHLICEKPSKRPLSVINVPFVFSDGTFHPKSDGTNDVDPFWVHDNNDNNNNDHGHTSSLSSPSMSSPSMGVSTSHPSSTSRSTIVLLVLMVVSLILITSGLSITVYMQRKYIQERRCMRESRMNIYYSSSITGTNDGDAEYEDPSKF